MIGRVWLWANATDPRTWALHALIAVLVAFAWSWQVALGFYLLREVEQVIHLLAKRERLHPLDHLMDVAAPAAALAAFEVLT